MALRRVLIACAAVLALAACDRQAKTAPAAGEDAGPQTSGMAAPKGFTHEAKVDVGGFFLPKGDIQIGNYKLTHLFAGSPAEFQAWEKGERLPNFGPLMLQFDDVTSPVEANELGQPHHTVTVRVLPVSYHLTKAALAFHGKDPTLGSVTFAGAFNQKGLAAARKGESGEASVLKGDLEIGDKTFGDVAFTYFAGD